MMRKKFFDYTVFVVCSACFLATSVDIPLSWTSPMFPKLKSNDTSDNPLGRPITEDEDGWIGSLVTLGAVVGPFLFSPIIEKFGRKIGLLASALPITVSFYILAFATKLWLYYLARFLAGISMGAGYALLPMYVAEISEDHNRGVLSQLMNIFWSLGSFLSYVLGPFMSLKMFNIALGCIPTIFFCMFAAFAPESPYFLMSRNKTNKAKKSLFLLRNGNKGKIDKEMEKIRLSLSKDEEESKSILDLFKSKASLKAFVICAVLVMTQELCGFCAILFYLQTIFDAAGTSLASDTSSIIVSVFLLTSSFINPFFIDRSGRRLLTIVSCSGMAISLTFLGLFFYLQSNTNINTDPIYWLPLLSLIFYIFSFNFGISSVPWTLTSELFPTRVRNLSLNIISVLCWTTSFVVTKCFNYMNAAMGRAGSFWVFAGFCYLAVAFSVFFVPETKGKSFTEIQDMLEKGRLIQIRWRRKKEVKIGDVEFIEINGINGHNNKKH